MSVLVTLTILFLLPGSAVSQAVPNSANCTGGPTGPYTWMFNSMGQSPCAVATYLESTCWPGSPFTIKPLPSGYHYTGPDSSHGSDPCMCNTVTYSLISACDACQGSLSWITWADWIINCTDTQPVSTFPHPVPNDTSVPHWALIDVTLEGTWNLDESRGTGDNPETGPGTAIGPSSSSGPSAAPTGATRPTGNLLLATSTSSNGPSKYTSAAARSASTPSSVSTSDTGAIVGGIIGGIALIGIIIITIVYIRRQRNVSPCAASSAWAAPSAPLVMDVLPQSPTEYEGKKPLSDDGTFASSFIPGSPVTSVRAYNSNITTTLPEPQDDPYSPRISNNTIFGQHQGSGNNLPFQASRPKYHGFPNV